MCMWPLLLLEMLGNKNQPENETDKQILMFTVLWFRGLCLLKTATQNRHKITMPAIAMAIKICLKIKFAF